MAIQQIKLTPAIKVDGLPGRPDYLTQDMKVGLTIREEAPFVVFHVPKQDKETKVHISQVEWMVCDAAPAKEGKK